MFGAKQTRQKSKSTCSPTLNSIMERTAKRQKKEYNDDSDGDDDFQNEDEIVEDEETEVANAESPVVAHKEKFAEHDKYATIKDMMVRQIIKENHGKEITQLAMNYSDPRFSNMVATVGDCQVRMHSLAFVLLLIAL